MHANKKSPDSGTLLAKCENCASWRPADLGAAGGHGTAIPVNGVCTRGLAPEPGELRCESYQMGEAFQQQVIARMLQDDPMALPVPLRALAEAKRRKAR